MSDDSPWMPPTQRGDNRRLSDPDEAGDQHIEAPSPWSREAPSFESAPPPPPATPDHADVGRAAASDDAADPSRDTTAENVWAVGSSEGATEPGEHAFGGLVVEGSTSLRRGRSRLVIALGVAALVAIGLAGIFAVRRLTGETASGAETPDELGQELFDAVESEDVLGIIDALLPGERDAFGEPFVEMVSELQRLDVLSSDLDLSQLAGLDVQLSNRVVDVAPTNVSDIVNVALRADVVVTVDGERLPLGDLIEERMPPDMLLELRGSKQTQTDSLDVTLAAVLDEGRWYFSLLHTAAESLRGSLEASIPAEGIGAVGAESPEAVVDAMFDRMERLDLRGLIQGLDPYEARALQRYAPLFLDDAEAAIAEQSGALTVDVVDRAVRVEGSGGSRTAFIDGLTVVVDGDGGTATLTYADGCVRFEADGVEPIEHCGGADLSALESLDIGPEGAALIAALSEAFADIEPAGIELRERDGAWYVSPIASVTEAMLNAMRALDRAELERIADAGTDGAEQLVDAMFRGIFAAGIGLGSTEFESFDDPGFGISVDEGAIGEDAGASPVDECYLTSDAALAKDCFDGLLASGQVESWEVPVALRYPQCGLAEASWTSSYYEMTDDEFTVLMTAAQACFQGLVDRGELDVWEVPYEVAHVACFEGRNWYTAFEDDYTTRVFDCIAAEGS